MKDIDVRFDSAMMNMLKDMIGKNFEKFRSDPFEFSPLVYGLAGIYVGGNVYKLDNFVEVRDFYGHQEDVAVFKLHSANGAQIESCLEQVQMIDTPIQARIVGIRLVEENQQLYVDHKLTYNVWLTRGVIFDLDDGREVSFEKAVWFSEMIDIQKGYNVLDTYASTEGFLEEWDGTEGYEGKCTRVVKYINNEENRRD